jgi:hypothetical protein
MSESIRPPDGYVGESMFFNPRKETATYLVTKDDLLLVENQLIHECEWTSADWTVVGMEFKDVLKLYPNVKSIAIPMKFEFDTQDIHYLTAHFDWNCLGIGFGQMSFEKIGVNEPLTFDTECMGRETTRKMLHDFVDFIVDNGISDDWKSKENKDD